ncbi:MAG: cytochrome P450 [Gammaproteobacteria bacterium]
MSASDRPVVDFDHHSPQFAAEPERQLADLRSRCPIAWTERYGGFWMLTGYDAIAEVARDDYTFSSRHDVGDPDSPYKGTTIPQGPMLVAPVPVEIDPPEFIEWRRIVNPMFSPSAVAPYAPFIEEVVTACLDAVIESGRIDFVLDLANPVPAIVILKILGLPLEEWERYAQPQHDLVAYKPGTSGSIAAGEGIAWTVDQLRLAIADRRAHPRPDDYITRLTQSTVDGRPVSDERILGHLTVALSGGVDTTTALFANVIHHLSAHPADRARLIAEPGLIPQATEEFLRYFCPVTMMSRTVAKDTEVQGVQMREGERLMLAWAGANRDPAWFDRPDDLILDRFPNRHMTFGVGGHRCLGSNLARLDFQILLRAVLERLPDFQVDADRCERYPSRGVVNGFVRMPATFTPGSRRGSTFFLRGS